MVGLFLIINSVPVKESSLGRDRSIAQDGWRSVKRKTGPNPESKGIEHDKKHGETKPGKCLEVMADNKVADIPEGFQVNFFQE